jgi:hypothetical protein
MPGVVHTSVQRRKSDAPDEVVVSGSRKPDRGPTGIIDIFFKFGEEGVVMNGDVLHRYIANGYFAETVVADGPQEARFRFAMKYGVRPDLVEVSPPIRMRQFEYWCSVGTAPDPYLSTEVVS